MSNAQARRDEILALEPRLLEAARSLTPDLGQAEILVRQTLHTAIAPGYGQAEEVPPQVWLFRLLRQTFHSVERDRVFRRARSVAAIELGLDRRRAELAPASDQPSPIS